jgi:two-component system nitrogen regulation response regulator GlnG
MALRILCVDDDEETCGLVSHLLKAHEVVCVHSKAQALWRATAEPFDLILLDYHLPDGTGLEICMLLRSIEKLTPILFCTASDLTINQALRAGAQGFIKKGPDFVEGIQSKVTHYAALS